MKTVLVHLPSRQKGSPHAEGKGVDITIPGGKSGDINGAMCCAFQCGMVYVQDEYNYPSSQSSGPHIHMQTRPEKGGTTVTGSKPKPKGCRCYLKLECCGGSE